MHRMRLPLSQAQLLKWRTTTRAFHCARCECSKARGQFNVQPPPRPNQQTRTPIERPTTSRAPDVPPVSEKSPEEPSIFAQLFETKASGDNGASQPKPSTIAPSHKENPKVAVKPATVEDYKPDDAIRPSIFEQLFQNAEPPESRGIAPRRKSVTRLARRPGENVAETGNSKFEPIYTEEDLLENTMSLSIRNHFRNWALEEGILPETAPKLREYGSHSTVLVLSSVSPNLQESDFYRIAPQGKHLEGWSNGLMKVVQVHDSNTYQPLGQYFLFFHSKPFALDYMEKVKHLHELSKRTLFAGRKRADGDDVDPPYPQVREEDEEALGAFTLVPPSVDVDIGVRLWNSDFVRDAMARSNIKDIIGETKLGPSTDCKVALALSRGGLSLHDLRLAIEEDGKSRNLPWKLHPSWDSIMPIKMIVSGEQEKARSIWDIEGSGTVLPVQEEQRSVQTQKDSDEDANERFPRFLLTFANAVESRRFARNWHKRTVHDDVNRWTVEAETTALW